MTCYDHEFKKPERLPLYSTQTPAAETHKRPSRSDIKPLTDDEIYLCTNHIDRNIRGWANEFARAIEAAHGIKG